MLKWSQMTFRFRLPYCLFPECTKWNKIPFLPAPQCISASDCDKHLYKKIKNKKKSQNTFREGKKRQQYWAQNGSNCRVLFNSWSRWRFILKCQKHKKMKMAPQGSSGSIQVSTTPEIPNWFWNDDIFTLDARSSWRPWTLYTVYINLDTDLKADPHSCLWNLLSGVLQTKGSTCQVCRCR